MALKAFVHRYVQGTYELNKLRPSENVAAFVKDSGKIFFGNGFEFTECPFSAEFQERLLFIDTKEKLKKVKAIPGQIVFCTDVKEVYQGDSVSGTRSDWFNAAGDSIQIGGGSTPYEGIMTVADIGGSIFGYLGEGIGAMNPLQCLIDGIEYDLEGVYIGSPTANRFNVTILGYALTTYTSIDILIDTIEANLPWRGGNSFSFDSNEILALLSSNVGNDLTFKILSFNLPTTLEMLVGNDGTYFGYSDGSLLSAFGTLTPNIVNFNGREILITSFLCESGLPFASIFVSENGGVLTDDFFVNATINGIATRFEIEAGFDQGVAVDNRQAIADDVTANDGQTIQFIIL